MQGVARKPGVALGKGQPDEVRTRLEVYDLGHDVQAEELGQMLR